jgi:phosphohistidine phosphatase
MKRLLLVRHGPAAGKAQGGSDRDRPLTAEGRRAVEAIALRLRAAGATADLVLCSSARRARETLDIILAGRPLPEVEFEDALYLADAKSLQHRLRELPAAARSVLLVGHNPGLQELATMLAGPGGEAISEGLPAAGAAVFDVEGDWGDLAPGTTRLRAFYSP